MDGSQASDFSEPLLHPSHETRSTIDWLQSIYKLKNTQRVLITGGARFLRSHLCEYPLAPDCEVLCVDNLFTGNKANIAHMPSNSSFELMRHDVTFPLCVEVDQIYNLACPASPIPYQRDPVQTTKNQRVWCHQYARAGSLFGPR